MKARRRLRRDQDYRGQTTTVDWARLVHQVKLRKPGALEVLQDAINTYFPRQFREAQAQALVGQTTGIYGQGPSKIYYVGFNARVARMRFKPAKDARSFKDMSPLVVVGSKNIRTSKPNPFTVYVWSTRGSKKLGWWPGTAGKSREEQEIHKEKYFARVERKGTRPAFTGSYKRPKVPIIYWYREEYLGDDAATTLLVRGSRAASWAKDNEVFGENWEMWRDTNGQPIGAILRFYHRETSKDWRKDARKEGVKNKFKYLEYPPSRSWFG